MIEHRFVGDDLAQSGRQLASLLPVGTRQQDEKLVTAHAKYMIIAAHMVAQTGRHLAQQRIPTGVAMEIVDLFEAIDIHHDGRKIAAIAFESLSLQLAHLFIGATILQSGQGIGTGSQLGA